MRSRSSALAASAALALPVAASLVFAPAAAATGGDNGTVKIHDAKTGEELKKNEPHICEFYLDAFQFDTDQDVNWKILVWAPSEPKGEVAKDGTFQLDAQGHGRTADMSLPEGHYKLVWNFDGEKGKAKHKVFWSDCKGEPSAPPSGSTGSTTNGTTGGSTGGSEGSTGGSEGSSGEQSTSGSVEETSGAVTAGTPTSGESVSPDSSTAPQTAGDLAETGAGAPIGLLATGAAVLVGGGVLLTRRLGASRRG